MVCAFVASCCVAPYHASHWLPHAPGGVLGSGAQSQRARPPIPLRTSKGARQTHPCRTLLFAHAIAPSTYPRDARRRDGFRRRGAALCPGRACPGAVAPDQGHAVGARCYAKNERAASLRPERTAELVSARCCFRAGAVAGEICETPASRKRSHFRDSVLRPAKGKTLHKFARRK